MLSMLIFARSLRIFSRVRIARENHFSSLQNQSESFLVQRTNQLFQKYEDIIGLTDVKRAQQRVIQAEQKFVSTQEARREHQNKIQELQNKLKEIHTELTKTVRGEDRYLHLVTQEHALLREERTLLENFRSLEKDERDYFSALSLAVRESHEQERAQSERTKYWSVIGSICGAIIGIAGTTINNRLRMKELRELVSSSAVSSEVSSVLKIQQERVEKFLSDLRLLMAQEGKMAGNQADILDSLELEAIEKRLSGELQEIKVLLTSQMVAAKDGDQDDFLRQPSVTVYYGKDLGQILKNTEANLEWRMKINSLATVAAFYGIIAVIVPIFYYSFK